MTYIRIKGWGEMELEYLLSTIRSLKDQGNWTLQNWKPVSSLNEKNGRTSAKFMGQGYDPVYFDLVKDGWTHDHCELCTKTISDNPSNEEWETQGYSDGRDWICEQCYQLFMTSDKPED